MGEFRARAVLFDKDGVLLDTMAMIRSTWAEWAAHRGVDPVAVLASIHMTAYELFERFAPSADPQGEIRWIAARQAALEPSIKAFDGAAQLLASLPAGAWAVVTSARCEPSARHLRAAGLPVPSVLVCAEETPRGKPDPAGYLLAAARLDARPDDCMVVEDAPAGIRAGKAAGMFVVAIASTCDPPQLAEADANVPSIRSLRARSEDGAICLSWRTEP